MAYILGQSSAALGSNEITEIIFNGGAFTLRYIGTSGSNPGDILVLKASDPSGFINIPLYNDGGERQIGPNQYEIRGTVENDIYNTDSANGVWTPISFDYIDFSAATKTETSGSCSFEDVYKNSVYGKSMISYNLVNDKYFVLPRRMFKFDEFKSVMKDMGSFLLYNDRTKVYKIIPNEETLQATGNKFAKSIKFNLPTR